MNYNCLGTLFKEIACYYRHENDLSNITVALCNASSIFKDLFLRFFFPQIISDDIIRISREARDINGMGCRVDIHISMKSGDPYIIEVKINDTNHHFGQYESAYKITKDHFGYITNYYCIEGVRLGYNVKTWEEIYYYFINLKDKNELIEPFLFYIEKVCNLRIYSTSMNFKALSTIPHFYEIIDEIINENKDLGIIINSERSSTFEYSYKGFNILNTEDSEIISRGCVLLHYAESEIISIGIAGSRILHLEEMENKLKNRAFEWFQTPYIDSDWWYYLWFSLSENKVKELQTADQKRQKGILKDFLIEVIKTIRTYANRNTKP